MIRREWKKAVAAVSALAVAGTMLAACGSSSGSGSTTAATGGDAADTAATTAVAEAEETKEAAAADFGYPIEGGGTITYWCQLNPNVSANFTNLGDTEMAKALSEQTGVTVDYQHAASGQETEQFNLMIADGNLPDVMEWNWVTGYSGGPEKALGDGVIIPLNDIIDQYCPNLKKYLEENPDIDKMIKTDDGNYYCFPFARGDEGLCYTVGAFIRKDWLDDLGLEVPTSIEEWHTVLTAFKEEKGAAAPITFSWSNFSKSNPFAYAYGVGSSNGSWWLIGDDGEVAYGPALDSYKDYLMTMNQWYTEGLIDPDIATVTGDQLTYKMTSGEAGASVGWAASNMQVYITTAQAENPDYSLVTVPSPSVNTGETAEYGYMETQYTGQGAAITTSCENVELVARFLDYGYSEEGHNLFNFGIEGVSYNWDGDHAVYTEEITNNPDGWPIAQALGKYIRANYSGVFIQDLNYLQEYLQVDTVKEAPSTWAVATAKEHTLPAVTATEDESKELSTIINELNTYVSEMTLKFIFGTESFDNWDTYTSTLKGMNLDRAIEIQSGALERYNAR